MSGFGYPERLELQDIIYMFGYPLNLGRLETLQNRYVLLFVLKSEKFRKFLIR